MSRSTNDGTPGWAKVLTRPEPKRAMNPNRSAMGAAETAEGIDRDEAMAQHDPDLRYSAS